MKKLASIVLAIGMIVSTLITPVSAASSNQVNTFSRVESYTYSDVREYIQEAHSGVTLTISETPVHYYYGDGYTAYEKNGEYYIIKYNEDYTSYDINGYTVKGYSSYFYYPMPFNSTINSANTTWTYLFTDVFWQLSVGGLFVEVVMGMIPEGTFSSIIMEQIAEFLIDKAIDLVLPNNFALTIRDDWYYANLDPWMGTVDYSHDLSAWWGYTRDPYMEHIAGDNYTGEIIERDII